MSHDFCYGVGDRGDDVVPLADILDYVFPGVVDELIVIALIGLATLDHSMLTGIEAAENIGRVA